MTSIFKPCDIRGKVGVEWDERDAADLGAALARLLQRRGESVVCVGGDFRRSTPALKVALTESLLRAGLRVVDVGQVATPVVYFAAHRRRIPNVVIVTASHNPAEYNGVKVTVQGQPGVPELLNELKAEFDRLRQPDRPPGPTESAAGAGDSTDAPTGPSGSPAGRLERFDPLPEYERWVQAAAAWFVEQGLKTRRPAVEVDLRDPDAERLLQEFLDRSGCQPATTPTAQPTAPTPTAAPPHATDVATAPTAARPSRAAQPLRVALDTMAGAFTPVAERVLSSAGFEVCSVGREVDPDFSRRPPNPAVEKNLKPLLERVAEDGCDVGVALDGDGDRVVFVDAHSRVARPEQMAVVLASELFDRPTVVYDLKCASVVARAVEQAGGRTVPQPSGHGFIRQAVQRERADLGVEVSGHHFYGVLSGGDDGLFTALVVLELLRRRGRTLAELVGRVPWPCITPDLRVPFDGDANELLERTAVHCGGRVTRLDGVRAEYPDGWALLRVSITEPAVTLRFEASDPAALFRLVRRFLAGAPELRDEVLRRLGE